MSKEELVELSAVELRRRIGTKEISPVELLEACLARIEKMNPAVNAVTAMSVKRARQEAKAAEVAVRRGEDLPSTPQRLRVRVGGRVHEVLARPGATVLEAGLAAGLPMPSSCTMGGCGACRVKARGALVHDTPNALEPDEEAAGYAFACIARPLGPCDIEVP